MRIGSTTMAKLQAKYGDDHFTDYASEYGEPGYSCDSGVILGSFWCRCADIDGLHDIAAHYPRVFAALEESGYSLEWNDEWMVDGDSSKAYRTTADSYGWTPSIAYFDGDILTPESDVSEWIAYAVNDSDVALTGRQCHKSVLVADGWALYESGFESGWRPGQTADPAKILSAVQADRPGHDVVFYIDGVGQFDLEFSVYVRPMDTDDDD